MLPVLVSYNTMTVESTTSVEAFSQDQAHCELSCSIVQQDAAVQVIAWGMHKYSNGWPWQAVEHAEPTGLCRLHCGMLRVGVLHLTEVGRCWA